MAAPLRQLMQADLTPAMKARDRAKVSVLRSTLAALANAEAVDGAVHAGAVEVERRALDHDEMIAIIRRERDGLRALADHMAGAGRADEAEDLATQVEILEAYLAM